ncbi:hypothetical protein [Streptomyces incanus]|uniref:Uncharacterized protein n=1 Tax=Streptomyces incanus TaxID=887453 RepID=A0ABW0XKB4_9ACTN
MPADGAGEVDEGAGAAGDQGHEADLGVSGPTVVARLLGAPGQDGGGVGDRQGGAVECDHQQTAPTGSWAVPGGGRAAQQGEQPPQRLAADAAAGLGRRARRRGLGTRCPRTTQVSTY